MKTQITFQFDTAEEAIAWMAKALLDEKKPKAAEKAGASQSAGVPASAGAPRTPTPPAEGQPKRGPGRPKKADLIVGGSLPAASPAPAPATPSAEAPEIPAAVKNPPAEEVRGLAQTPPAGTPTPGDVVSALQRVLTAKGMPAAQAIFQRHGVKRAAEVKPEDRVAFIAYCDKVVAGTIDPTKAAA